MNMHALSTPTATVPSISTTELLAFDGPENEALRTLINRSSRATTELQGKRIAVLATDGVEEIELTLPMHVLRSRGAQVDLIAPAAGATLAKLGLRSPEMRSSHILTVRFMENAGWIPFDRKLEEAHARDFDAIYLPGGAWSPDTLRLNSSALEFVRAASAAGKLIASICHGPQILIDANLVRGKRTTGYWAIHTDLKNAGAEVIDAAVVHDGNLMTSRYRLDLAPFLDAFTKALQNRT
jgi:protease I